MKTAYRFSRLIAAFILVHIFTYGSPQLYAQLNLSPSANVSTTPGATITIPLNLNNPNANPIDAFGLKFLYPTNLLTFQATENAGTLSEGWIVARGQENVAGQITVGGFNSTAATGSGILIKVIFRVKEGISGSDSMKLRDFRDDLATATTTDGFLTVTIGTTVENRQASLLPTQFDLSQNFPNPFNPQTKIEFRIADFGAVSLKVYDITGREVATLIDEKLQPARYEVKFDAGKLSGGLYFYQLRTGDFTATKKMIVAK